ncbi:MAG: chemotaxis protein CheA [Dehalococcoidales bacterium]
MNLDPDITPEELKVFLEEAEDQIELLDKDIVRLEKEGENPDLIQEIFRMAHTLKGSSAMVGHQAMAELTHAMESLLDKIRSGDLSVSPRIIDALFFSLDAIKILKNEITSSEDSGLDIQPAILMLQEAIGGEENKQQVVEESVLTLDQDTRDNLQTALARGQYAYYLDISVDEASEWAAIRCLQCLNELARIGEVICSSPSAREIDEEKVGHNIKIILTSSEDKDTVQGMIFSITEIVGVEITSYNPEEETGSNEKSDSEEQSAVENVSQAAEKSTIRKIKAIQQESSQNLQSVKVDVKVLDNLMNIVEELVIDRSNISQVGKMLEAKYSGDKIVQQLAQTSDHIIKVINELQESIMRVRMVPIGTIFSRFPRMVRDLAQTQRKKIDFIVAGEDTELDRSLIEQVRDPLIHLLRNAVDHGIEPSEKRKAANKPETAVIYLTAEREQSHIVITVEDDGGGISADRIRESAVKKGFLSAEQAESLSDSEAINLIFKAGLSTAKKTSDVSGRGVGLDIVRANVENLSGSVLLDTKPGRGSKFTIRLPLTVAIVQGLLVTVGGTIYVLPLASVIETLALKPGDIYTIRKKEIIRRMDNLIPIVRLNATFNSQVESPENSADKGVIIVAKAGKSMVGLIVDSLMEPQEIVVKSLGKYMGEIAGIAGATILGDGRVALILDVVSLVKIVAHEDGEKIGQGPHLVPKLTGAGV